MRISQQLIACVGLAGVLLTGCAGPERKLGRGLNNAGEILRMGELTRSMEQTAIWGSTDSAYGYGLVHGLGRTLARTGAGIYEIATFPIPSYKPFFKPEYRGFGANIEDPVYPDSYKPLTLSDPMFSPDAALGFSGGDVAPMFPGSRFRVFDY
ncbi:MAG: exosortase system-associated protein, TIGR04073 family [Verrucomicrobia bacterium]|jgi:putative exosortase-associated protein (TIGR04073 family)|nr:MAG: exosortase system-associated protein, TIGR04073 family [Verrucomicrobiota bacterium]